VWASCWRWSGNIARNNFVPSTTNTSFLAELIALTASLISDPLRTSSSCWRIGTSRLTAFWIWWMWRPTWYTGSGRSTRNDYAMSNRMNIEMGSLLWSCKIDDVFHHVDYLLIFEPVVLGLLFPHRYLPVHSVHLRYLAVSGSVLLFHQFFIGWWQSLVYLLQLSYLINVSLYLWTICFQFVVSFLGSLFEDSYSLFQIKVLVHRLFLRNWIRI